MAKEIKYFKDKNATIIVRTTTSKKGKFKDLVKDMSASINKHIDEVIENNNQK